MLASTAICCFVTVVVHNKCSIKCEPVLKCSLRLHEHSDQNTIAFNAIKKKLDPNTSTKSPDFATVDFNVIERD